MPNTGIHGTHSPKENAALAESIAGPHALYKKLFGGVEVGMTIQATVAMIKGIMLQIIANRLMVSSLGKNKMMIAPNNGKNVIAVSIEKFLRKTAPWRSCVNAGC